VAFSTYLIKFSSIILTSPLKLEARGRVSTEFGFYSLCEFEKRVEPNGASLNSLAEATGANRALPAIYSMVYGSNKGL